MRGQSRGKEGGLVLATHPKEQVGGEFLRAASSFPFIPSYGTCNVCLYQLLRSFEDHDVFYLSVDPTLGLLTGFAPKRHSIHTC